MANDLKNETSPPSDAPQPREDRQTEPRLTLSIHIEVSGIDRSAQPFCEKTQTISVSHRGCRFKLHREVAKDSIVAIRVISTLSGLPADPQLVMFQVMYTVREKDAWVLGVWTLQPEVEWSTDIPKRAEPAKCDPGTATPISKVRMG